MKKAKKGFGVSELFMIIAAVVIVTVVFTLITNVSNKTKSTVTNTTKESGTIDNAIHSAGDIATTSSITIKNGNIKNI